MTTEPYQTARRAKGNSSRSPRSKKPYSEQYARRAKHFIPLDRDPFYLESVDRDANPRGLSPTVDWFYANPSAEYRLVATRDRDHRWFAFTFYPRAPRWAGGYTLFATNLRDVLAEPRFKTGTPRERLTRVYRWLKNEGVFVDPF
jgi:hypothetical protein